MRKLGGLRTVLVVVGALTLAAAAVLATRFGSDPSSVDSPLVGKPVPEAALELFATGDEVRLNEVDADVLVVNFWAPWCGPCLLEHQELNAAAGRHGDESVAFAGIAVHSERAEIDRFLDRVGPSIPTLIDAESRPAIDFGVFGVPETFFIDGEGIVRARVTGPVDGDLIDEMIERLRAGREVTSLETGEIQTRQD